MPVYAQTEWQLRFATRLHQLLPGLGGAEAARIAQSSFADSRDLDPDDAAEIYALEAPPGDVSAAEG